MRIRRRGNDNRVEFDVFSQRFVIRKTLCAERFGKRRRGILIYIGDRNEEAAIAGLKRLRVGLGDSARSDECKF